MNAFIHQQGQQYNISNYISDFSISGSIQQASRQCDIKVLYPNYDKTIQKLDINCGSILQIFENAVEIYRGYVFSKDFDSTSNTLNLTAYDGLIYMTKSQTCKTYKNQTPEYIVQDICNEFSIPVSNLAYTGDNQNYVANNKTLYQIMMEVYTHAAKINGKKYYPIFIDGSLNVIEKGELKSGITFNGDNIRSLKTSESIDNMINKVVVYDNNQSIIATAENTDWSSAYGILQTTLSRDEKKDNQKMANAALKGMERKIQIEMPGNIYLKTGYAIDVNFPLYSVNSTLFIESDKHDFSNGIYTTSLTLDYENTMDEQEGDDGSDDN